MRVIPVNLPSLIRLCENALPEEVVQYEALTGRAWDPDEVAVDYFTRGGEQFLMVDDTGLPLVAGGWEPLRAGVYRAWMVGTPSAWATHGLGITLACRRIMDSILDEGARRLELLCLASRTKACRWYTKGLRMRFEGAHLGFGDNGETAATYARVRGNG